MSKFQQPNMANLMKQAQKMQQEMAKAQEEITQMSFEATSGGGAVKVTAGGDKKLKSIEIDPELLSEGDAEMLSDMLMVAVNDALEKAEEATQSRMGALTGGFNLPGM